MVAQEGRGSTWDQCDDGQGNQILRAKNEVHFPSSDDIGKSEIRVKKGIVFLYLYSFQSVPRQEMGNKRTTETHPSCPDPQKLDVFRHWA